MNLRSIAISMIVLKFVSTSADAQSSSTTPPPELKKWDVWIGDWKLSGIAKDTPTGPEYKVNWYLHEHWILGGFFVQVDQTWKGNGQELHSIEILSYDPVKKIHTVSGFSGDGWTWALTATFNKTTTTEEGVATGPDGANRNVLHRLAIQRRRKGVIWHTAIRAERSPMDSFQGQRNEIEMTH
jgi:hypothetical protein